MNILILFVNGCVILYNVVVTEVLSGITVAEGDGPNVLCDRWIPTAQRVNQHNNELFIKYD